MIKNSEVDGVRTIAFNRSNSLNAFTPEILGELNQALNVAQNGESTKVVILKGEGRDFSAGVELKVRHAELAMKFHGIIDTQARFDGFGKK